jgi:hypothetical protein
MMAGDTNARIKKVNALVTSSVKEFSDAIEEFATQLVPESLILMQKKLVLDLLAGVVRKTPVDTGRARGNWQVEVGSVPQGVRNDRDGESEEAIIQAASENLRSLGFAQVVWVANNLEYVVFLEDGSSEQAPAGMLRVTLEELRRDFE